MKKRAIVLTALAAASAIAATVFAVKKGPELKDELLTKVDDLKEKIKNTEVSDVTDAISLKISEIKESIHDFDWEKSKDEVEKKFYEIKNQIRSVKKHIPLTGDIYGDLDFVDIEINLEDEEKKEEKA